jgi:magnesium-transporting ATPase (P-type)
MLKKCFRVSNFFYFVKLVSSQKYMPENRPFYQYEPEEILTLFGTGVKGLSEEEILARQLQYGKNTIEKKRDYWVVKLFLRQFNDVFVWILGVAGLLAVIVGESRDAIVIGIIIMVNTLMGFFQEFKAERILEKLAQYMTDRAIVIRGGEKHEIDANDIVPGDVVFLDGGSSVPADGYILEAYNLKVNSFIFSGESVPEERHSGAMQGEIRQNDIENMLFTGELVVAGEGRMVVVGTGTETELGKMAQMTADIKQEPTPLQKKMTRFGHVVALLSVGMGIIVLTVGQQAGLSLYESFLLALALSVSVVPEGLPAAVSVAFALGMRRLLKHNVLAKKLSAVETLGSVSIICSDKTGTITKNELTVTQVVLGTTAYQVSGVGYTPEGEFSLNGKPINATVLPGGEMLFRIGALCNSSSLVVEKGVYSILGDPTEGAILVATRKYNEKQGFFEIGNHKIFELPFASERMRMSVVYQNGITASYVKGSPDALFELSTHWMTPEGRLPFTIEDKVFVRSLYDKLSSQALRVLAFAYRDLEGIDASTYTDEAENRLTWVGMMAMIDPPRAGTKEAIQQCREYGIRVVMMTGDYEKTALAIAREIGFFSSNEKEGVVNGAVVPGMTDQALLELLKQDIIFARIAPAEKLRIAALLQCEGHIVAMTGDGVNDALALKKADIGIAMGIIGTDVSKDAADMILLDDRFASIVSGIREGRTIFSNLKKFVHYVFTSNASELFTVLIGFLLHIPMPITAIQILATDLATDLLPSFALGMEPEEPGTQQGKTSNRKQRVMEWEGVWRIVILGLMMASGAVTTFLLSLLRDGWVFGESLPLDGPLYVKATTAAYITIALTQMANLLQSRSATTPFFKMRIFSNLYVWGAMTISIAMMISFTNLPFFQSALGMTEIGGIDWLTALTFTLLIFFYEEARKTRLWQKAS